MFGKGLSRKVLAPPKRPQWGGLCIKLVPKRDEKMVWKQDLAQFKQQMKPDQEPAGPPLKPILPPLPSQSLEDADLLFLRAMGGGAVPPVPGTNDPVKEGDSLIPSSPVLATSPTDAKRAISVEDSRGDFTQALEDLKGLRPLLKNPVFSAPGPKPATVPALEIPPPGVVQAESQPPLPIPVPISMKTPSSSSDLDNDMHLKDSVASPEAIHIRSGPVLMHLAAGMAIEVDGTLDLRRHSLNDAKERLKERIRDGVALGWRTLLVTLGPNEALKQGFLVFLTTPQAQLISRYAQAPVPMGGAQAWVLYLNQPSQPVRKEEA